MVCFPFWSCMSSQICTKNAISTWTLVALAYASATVHHKWTFTKLVCSYGVCMLSLAVWCWTSSQMQQVANTAKDVRKILSVCKKRQPPVPTTLMLWSSITSPTMLLLFFSGIFSVMQQKQKSNLFCPAITRTVRIARKTRNTVGCLQHSGLFTQTHVKLQVYPKPLTSRNCWIL